MKTAISTVDSIANLLTPPATHKTCITELSVSVYVVTLINWGYTKFSFQEKSNYILSYNKKHKWVRDEMRVWRNAPVSKLLAVWERGPQLRVVVPTLSQAGVAVHTCNPSIGEAETGNLNLLNY